MTSLSSWWIFREVNMNLLSYLRVEFVFVVHSDLIEGKRVSVQDVIKAVVGVKSGFSKCGNHDASPGSTRHQVSALTRHSYRDALHQLTTVVMYCTMYRVCVCVCVIIQGFVGFHVRPKLDTHLLIARGHLLDISLHFVQVHHQSRGKQGGEGLVLHSDRTGTRTDTHQIFLIQLNSYAWLVCI